MGVSLQMSWQKNQRRKSGAPLGLRNLGNTCYLNSVLQCLTYTPPLANFCIKHLHSTSCDTGKVSAGEKKSECPFCIIERRITRSLSLDSALDSPVKINNCLKIFAEHFRHGRQEDAHEFLRYVIDACHNTCLRIKKLQQQRRKGGYIENGNCNQNGNNGHTVVKEIFGGALQSQVKCLSCGADSNKVDEMMDISLDVLHSGSLKDALQRFFQPEILDGNNKYKCENCKKLVSARKQMSILQAPNVLVIQLKRFEGIYGGKIDKSIAFEEFLVLSSYMCKASQDPNPEYTLFGTIVHSGFSADTGHYYAYIKDAIGRWYCCNDSFVSVSSLKEVLSEKVYVLFFSRSKQRPDPSHTGVSANGAKSNAVNGFHTSKILNSGCLEKPVDTKQNGLSHSQLPNSSPSKTSTSPPTPPRKPSVFENINTKKPPKPPAAGCIKFVVNSRESMGKNGHMVSSEVKEKPVLSMVDRNGVAKSKTVNGEKMKLSSLQPLIDKTGVGKSESYPVEDSLKKTSLTSQSGIVRNGVSKPESGDSSNAERNNSSHAPTPVYVDCVGKSESGYTMDDEKKPASLSNGNGKIHSFTTDHSVGHHENAKSNGTLNTRSLREMAGDGCSPDNTGLKRKFIDEDECILLARDTKSRIKVEEFKEVIGREAASFLRTSGYSNQVYEHMHRKKKLCAEQDGCDASNHLELKRLLIADAKTTFISQLPDSVKSTLIEHLKSFSEGKLSSIT